MQDTIYERRRRTLTAHHEAGHALLHCLLDLPFLNVEILPPISSIRLSNTVPNLGFVRCEDGLCMGCVRDDLMRLVREDRDIGFNPADSVLIAMGGIAGEQAHWKRPRWKFAEDWIVGGGEHDYAEAREIAERNLLPRAYAKGDTQAYLRSQFFGAWEILRNNIKKHAALTEALLEKCILTYDECLTITGIRHDNELGETK